MGTEGERGKLGRELERLAEGSLTDGYQTAIAELMDQVQRVMDARGMTQRDLAGHMNVDPAFVSRKLNDPDNMTVRTLYRLCNAVGLQPSLSAELIEDEENEDVTAVSATNENAAEAVGSI
jgi:transcriptional regulator with XRE-family HTH domain